jgi:hypothetical protein
MLLLLLPPRFLALQGGDLREALSGDYSDEWQWRQHGKDVMLDVVRGVHFLHANQVVHRDIKSKVGPESVQRRRMLRAWPAARALQRGSTAGTGRRVRLLKTLHCVLESEGPGIGFN